MSKGREIVHALKELPTLCVWSTPFRIPHTTYGLPGTQEPTGVTPEHS